MHMRAKNNMGILDLFPSEFSRMRGVSTAGMEYGRSRQELDGGAIAWTSCTCYLTWENDGQQDILQIHAFGEQAHLVAGSG